MGALGWYMTRAFASGNGWSIATLAISYGIGFLYGGEYLLQRPALRQAGGLLLVLAVWMVPLALFGVLRGWVSGRKVMTSTSRASKDSGFCSRSRPRPPAS